MIDFLASLVARSVGTEPVIRPRIASLFESIREDVAPFANTLASRPEETFPSLHDEPDAEVPQKRNPEPHVARVSPRNSEQGTAQIAKELPAPSVIVPLPRHVREPMRTIVAEREVESDDAAAVPASPLRRDPSDRTLAAAAVRQEPETGRVKDPSVPPAIVSAAHAQAVEKAGRGLVIPPQIPADMRRSDLALSARPGRPLREHAHNRSSDASPPSEPSVQVTIGRIEVRVTKEAARATRPPSSSPVMSLEEYLRGRARQGGQ